MADSKDLEARTDDTASLRDARSSDARHVEGNGDVAVEDYRGGRDLPADWSPNTELHQRESSGYIGQWNTLVSQTNWEKGRVICDWRDALQATDAPVAEYSDEAWSRLVGGVTSQHVGRLRRVFRRFADQKDRYEKLYWSHFHAALDWQDAEMWLQGALDNSWSVSQMRNQRWETMGKLADQKPDPKDVIASELDEDLEVSERGKNDNLDDFQSSPRLEGPDFGDEDGGKSKPKDGDQAQGDAANLDDDDGRVSVINEDTVPGLRPFENIDSLPEDFGNLVEEFKLAIIRYKSEQWEDVSQKQMLEVLDGLKYLATSATDLVDD